MTRIEQLDDYTSGVMPEPLADALEETMFAAAANGADEDDRWFDRFYRLVQYVAQGDALVRAPSGDDLDDLRVGGVRVHVVSLGHGGACEWRNAEDEVDIVVTHLNVDLRGFVSIDAEVSNADGKVVHTFRDCLADPKTGHLYIVCAPPLARMGFGTHPRVIRLTGVHAERAREEIAVYETTPI